ncbi:MAG: hypothetical protein IPO26_08775 [Saprospiraceae bacterium]|nr:hypothetical protein [Saprospiraceae bacterium]MBK8826789.1 hypothetical protein [Saprospiraceae bacterium]HQV67939.1 hypothetical protein [Saprospiraceae bacterium]HQV97272.1 hypothetical protein [Saprospiraceae bacterium]
MLLHKRTLIFLIFFIIGNQNFIAQTMMDIFVTEIIDLNSVEDKEFFLCNINDLDQKVRHELRDCETLKFGSLECAEYKLNENKTDLENLTKITAYLRLYGYPSKKDFSEKASNTPWLVLHHNVGTATNIDKEFAPLLVEAYRKNDITLVNLHWYLKRYFYSYMGRPYERTTQTSETEDIEFLIRELKL